jgi:integrase
MDVSAYHSPLLKLSRERLSASSVAQLAFVLGKRKPRSVRWDAAVEEYLQEASGRLKTRTYGDYKRLLGHFTFTDARLLELTQHDFQKKLGRVAAPAEKLHAFVALRAFVNWCYAKHYVETNPIGRMKVASGSKSRERILTDAELGKVWNACPDDVFGRIVKVLILTGLRRGEVASLSGNMVGEDMIVLPPEVTKNARTHTLPCSPLVKSLIGSGLSFNGWGKCKARLDEASGVSEWTLHDLRRTFASGLAAQGVSVVVTEASEPREREPERRRRYLQPLRLPAGDARSRGKVGSARDRSNDGLKSLRPRNGVGGDAAVAWAHCGIHHHRGSMDDQKPTPAKGFWFLADKILMFAGTNMNGLTLRKAGGV